MSDDKPIDDPLIEDPEATARWASVVDLASVRVAMGFTRHPHRVCKHKRLTYSVKERRIWCQDCERTVDNFDAFMVLIHDFADMVRDAQARLDEAKQAKAAVVHRIAAKEMERIWSRKYAAGCPHCRHGLLPEDFAKGPTVMSRDLEIARRKKDKGGAND